MLKESRRILEIEINSSTDNPLIFTDRDIRSHIRRQFHGQYIAICSDSISIACHELAISISERRINQILDPNGVDIVHFYRMTRA